MKNYIKQLLRESIGVIIYRGGKPIDKSLVKSDGVSFTKDKIIADYWSSSLTDGLVIKYKLSPDANILKTEMFPERIIPKEKPYSHSDKERIVNYAKANKYDGVDLSDYFNESEIRIFNLNVITEILN